ncbi:class I mannose-6-phosphate isomerase [Tenacibaculum sp. S7007]|uniref:Phosphohexomutase n=1 Tax=Tenacibaculum pelagium TaxID=2759527 RepID=A0A839APY8_9FLAO|nr:type I phosphomannose isomerase catalytic subunit [Tenacibaculum pelagium]MBA6156279.1 class I mannose-6-phosphate isomerase [Tenacibaculum pelagium]
MKIYPLKFTPILKQKIWGGISLINNLNKTSDFEKNIGESWELSGVKGNESVVSNGLYKGISIVDLLVRFKGDLVGDRVYKDFGDKFPLLFKFIDAADDLSLQLHPNDLLAKKRHGSLGKTEMWYVLDAKDGSKIYAGFNKELNIETYFDFFTKGKILDTIHIDEVKKNDAFFIDVGTIHAIGKGILIAEIQQTSDITYRVYDWDRVDNNGKERELHTNLAIDALDFSKKGSCRLNYTNKVNCTNTVFSCNYFTTNKLNIDKELKRELKKIDSFVVYMCVEGRGEIEVEGYVEDFKKGETILIPACASKVLIKTNKNFQLLEVYI